jgi:hypothetical protein
MKKRCPVNCKEDRKLALPDPSRAAPKLKSIDELQEPRPAGVGESGAPDFARERHRNRAMVLWLTL